MRRSISRQQMGVNGCPLCIAVAQTDIPGVRWWASEQRLERSAGFGEEDSYSQELHGNDGARCCVAGAERRTAFHLFGKFAIDGLPFSKRRECFMDGILRLAT